MSTAAPATTPPPGVRITAIDVYRGIVMFLLGMRLLELDEVAKEFPDSALWQFIGHHSSHVKWVGCSLNDLIHPSFAFLTGASLVFAVSARSAKGQSRGQMALHALWRAVALIFIGIFLRSQGRPMTNWTFDETLTQTGLGYMVVYWLAFRGSAMRWSCFAALLAGHWLLYALYPVVPQHPHPMLSHVPLGWDHDFEGFYAHWNHNRNVGWAIDVWFMNLFPRVNPYVGYLGGYVSINFITTIGTMILGLMAGTWLKQGWPQTARRLAIAGLVCLAASLLLHFGGVCPLVKRLWTPAWVFWSGGCAFLILAALYHVIDVRQWRRWSFPFLVIGVNSLAFYLMRHTLDEWFIDTMKRHFRWFTELLGDELRPVMIGSVNLIVLWCIALWMYRRKIFLRL